MTSLTPEWRRRLRHAAQGRVQLTCETDSRRRTEAQLVDWSAEGFRATYGLPMLSSGQVVCFEHTHGSGRAKIVWNRVAGSCVESGFFVLND
jgi:hypothetical protein